MNVHNPAQSFFRPMVNTRFRQQFRRQKTLSWSGNRLLWLSIGKILLVLFPLVLVVNFWLAASFRNLEVSVQAVENARHELMDKQIRLRAQRAQLFSPEQIQLIAAEKFALHIPEKEQVKLF
jgi:uncharacterized protein (DUF58 family)